MGIEQPLAALGGGDPEKSWVRDEETDFRQIDSEDRALAQWAKQTGHFIPLSEVEALILSADSTADGNEHDVLLFRREGHVVRLTKQDMFGKPMRAPSEYLRRWLDFNRLFPCAAVEFIGYTQNHRGNGVILLRQPLIEGKKPTRAGLAKVMEGLGFEKLKGWEDAFRHPPTGIELWDAKPDNVIIDRSGNPIPIDVWVHDPQRVLK
jgi:hypothetical protein